MRGPLGRPTKPSSSYRATVNSICSISVSHMSPAESVRPASYVPRRFASGTFPVSKDYNLRQMLYNYSDSKGKDDSEAHPSDQVIPLFPFTDVPVYADTVDIESRSFVNASTDLFAHMSSNSAGVSQILGLPLDAGQCGSAHRYGRYPLSCLGGGQARRRVGTVSLFIHVMFF